MTPMARDDPKPSDKPRHPRPCHAIPHPFVKPEDIDDLADDQLRAIPEPDRWTRVTEAANPRKPVY